MKALTFAGLEKISLETVADPKIIEPGDAIVAVEAAAICGSDLHIYFGRERGLDSGTVMGHEFTGRIVEVGGAVAGLRRGDRVGSPFTTNCGSCSFCRRGLTARCQASQLFGWVQDGAGLHGGQAEYVRVPNADATLFALAEGITAEEGLLLGDILSTGYFCAEMAGIRGQEVQAVVGCGPVGLMAIIAAFELGANRLYAIDSVPERLARAAQLGAIPIDFSQTDPIAAVRDATDGEGADTVLEVVGSAAAGRLAMDLVRPGGTISCVGVHNEPNFCFSPVEAYDKNLTYKIGRCPSRYYMERLAPLVQQKKYDLSWVFSHHLSLDEGVFGYDLFANRKDGCTKVLLRPAG